MRLSLDKVRAVLPLILKLVRLEGGKVYVGKQGELRLAGTVSLTSTIRLKVDVEVVRMQGGKIKVAYIGAVRFSTATDDEGTYYTFTDKEVPKKKRGTQR